MHDNRSHQPSGQATLLLQLASHELRREERVEHPRSYVLIHAATIVLDFKSHVASLLELLSNLELIEKIHIRRHYSGSYEDMPGPFSDGFNGVAEEVNNHLPDLADTYILQVFSVDAMKSA